MVSVRLQPRDVLPETDSERSDSAPWFDSSWLRVQCDRVHPVVGWSCSVQPCVAWRVLQVPSDADPHDEARVSHWFASVLHDAVFDRWRCDHGVGNGALGVDAQCVASEVGLVLYSSVVVLFVVTGLHV